jgi:hypothetical protein
MKHGTLFFGVALATICSFVFAFAPKPGGDIYEVYLNNKLLLKQFVHQPLAVKALSLTKANVNDQLTVYYSHCGATGKGRSISIKDTKGNVLKKWNFRNASGSKTGMEIAVKELLQLESKNSNGSLTLYYAAQELPEGRLLTSLQFTGKSTAYQSQKESWPVLNAGSVLRIMP